MRKLTYLLCGLAAILTLTVFLAANRQHRETYIYKTVGRLDILPTGI